jgi:hypothetical protein
MLQGRNLARALIACGLLIAPLPALSQTQARTLMPLDASHSAEHGWLQKPVHARRDLDFARRDSLVFTGTGTLAIREPGLRFAREARVDMQMFRDAPAPTRSRLSSVHLRRNFGGQDWSAYNRLSIRIRARLSGLHILPIEILLRNDGAERVPDRYNREGIHYVTLVDTGWTQVVWEIDPLARDRVMSLELNYWVNKMFAAPGDSVAFEIGPVEIQRVDPDVHTGWAVGAGRIAYSHTGYTTWGPRTAVIGTTASGGERTAPVAELVDSATGRVVLRKPAVAARTSGDAAQDIGSHLVFDFSEVTAPGTYLIRTPSATSRPFRVGDDVWIRTIWKSLNFLYGNRCGYHVPGVHPVDHLDWYATLGADSIVMSGGWHDAGDLSQGVINTGELTYALFDLADRLRRHHPADTALLARVIEEANWGLDWVMRVRFPGGYRMYFAPHNLWTDNVTGTADDRSREAKNNPNANYIAAAAMAKAARALRDSDPQRAARALQLAREDWEHAVVGVESPETRHTPAFAATRMELAGIGITASMELYHATRDRRYAEKAVELGRVVLASQQTSPVGSRFPLSGFFYGGPDRDTLFHQFHRGNDQAPVVALAQLTAGLPEHPDRPRWESALRLHLAYQKRLAQSTAPWFVHPAYVYRETDDVKEVPDSGALHGATRAAYREMVRAGMAMGDGWYLRNFPVWFARRGNYGVLLSQGKALSAAGVLLGDTTAMNLASAQLHWVVGRNPFTQSTMVGEGYDWAQQYSVSSGDFVGTLPVGMQSRGHTDLPYWPAQNMYVYKEVWVHSTARWLWLIADLLTPVQAPVPARGGSGLR